MPVSRCAAARVSARVAARTSSSSAAGSAEAGGSINSNIRSIIAAPGDNFRTDFRLVDYSLWSAITTKPAAQASARLGSRFGFIGRFGLDLRLLEDSRLGFVLGRRIGLVVHGFGFFGRFFFGRLRRGFFNRSLGGLGLRLIGFGLVRLDRVDFRSRSGE